MNLTGKILQMSSEMCAENLVFVVWWTYPISVVQGTEMKSVHVGRAKSKCSVCVCVCSLLHFLTNWHKSSFCVFLCMLHKDKSRVMSTWKEWLLRPAASSISPCSWHFLAKSLTVKLCGQAVLTDMGKKNCCCPATFLISKIQRINSSYWYMCVYNVYYMYTLHNYVLVHMCTQCILQVYTL